MYYHGTLSIAVRKLDESQVEVQCVLLSTGYEAVATLRVDAGSFQVQSAVWQVHRSPESQQNGGGEAHELVGVEAYFKAGPALKAVGKAHGDLPRQLMAECVKGMIQAETYLFKERGYSTLQEYDDDYVKMSLDTCYLYSNMKRKTMPWLVYIANRDVGDCLFNRTKTISIHYENAVARAEGFFIDCFHELHITLEADAGLVKKVDGEFVRVPDPICPEVALLLKGFENKLVVDLTKSEVGKGCGGGPGCAHLSDLMSYMLQTLEKHM